MCQIETNGRRERLTELARVGRSGIALGTGGAKHSAAKHLAGVKPAHAASVSGAPGSASIFCDFGERAAYLNRRQSLRHHVCPPWVLELITNPEA